ncbi:MAG TPA: hypothetical protein PK509_01545 [Catalimonadaceae bacterium]|nr:hypothetical protein [Catalimonadaceae bacterium]HPI11539.1 hypothetical protein [Catalimonadaceae bacterium]
MIFGDLLKLSRWMALGAIFLCSFATVIAYFSVDALEGITVPLLVFGVFLWVMSVVWFLWGWLKNANDESNEGKGVSASSYILAFLPICYCYLMATDESRTKITVKVSNESGPVHSVKIFGSGSIFLNPDTLKLPGLAKGENATYELKAATAPGMKGDVQIIFYRGAEKFTQRIAGPFSIQPMNLKQDWNFVISEPGK